MSCPFAVLLLELLYLVDMLEIILVKESGRVKHGILELLHSPI